MRLISRAVWSILGASACLGAIANAVDDVLDIGVVFPRQNETYAPMERFPIVFALQNAALADNLKPLIEFVVLNGSMSMLDVVNERTFRLQWANYTTEPYLVYAFLDFRIEGPLKLLWSVWWRKCEQSGEVVEIIRDNSTGLWVDFKISDGAQQADLVAATAREEQCPAHVGLAINVTDETHDVPEPLSGVNTLHGICAVVGSSSPTPDSNPCRVRIDRAAVESMEAEELDRRCGSLSPPADCPEQNHGFEQLAVAGVATFGAVLGAAAFLLA